MFETEYYISQGPDDEVLGSTHGAADRSKFEGSALGKALESEVGTERGSIDGFSGGNGDEKVEVP